MSPFISHFSSFFFFNAPSTPEIYTLSLHDALPIWRQDQARRRPDRGDRSIALGAVSCARRRRRGFASRSEEHTSELQSRGHLVCRLLLEKKKKRERTEYVTNCMKNIRYT